MDEPYLVLVVDDDDDVLEVLGLVLESAGHGVVTADSPPACHAALERARPDLIILDIMLESLPGGLVLYEQIRGDPRLDTLPVIVISAIEDETGFMLDFHRDPFTRFIPKPIDPHHLLACIDELITAAADGL